MSCSICLGFCAAIDKCCLQLCWRCFRRLGAIQFFCGRCAMARYCSLVCKQQVNAHASNSASRVLCLAPHLTCLHLNDMACPFICMVSSSHCIPTHLRHDRHMRKAGVWHVHVRHGLAGRLAHAGHLWHAVEQDDAGCLHRERHHCSQDTAGGHLPAHPLPEARQSSHIIAMHGASGYASA